MIDQKKEFQENSVNYFRAVLDSMRIPMSQFRVKSAFYPKIGEKLEGIGPTDRIVGMFDSEAGKGVDIYMEVYNKDKDGNITPLDGRPLFCYKYREDYKDVYPWNGLSYAVKLSDLEVVNMINATEIHKPTTVDKPKGLSTSLFDNPLDTLTEVRVTPNGIEFQSEKRTAETIKVSELTAADIAAIFWRIPISGKPEINELIKNYK